MTPTEHLAAVLFAMRSGFVTETALGGFAPDVTQLGRLSLEARSRWIALAIETIAKMRKLQREKQLEDGSRR